MQILAKFSRKGIYYRENGELTQLPRRLENEVGKQAHTGHLGQKPPQTRLLRTPGSSCWGLPRGDWCSPPGQPGPNVRFHCPHCCHSPWNLDCVVTSTRLPAPKFLLVLATSPTAGLKSSVGASDWSSWLQGMLRKRVSDNFCFFGVNAACPHESHNLGESQIQDGDTNAVQLHNGTPTTFAGRVRD